MRITETGNIKIGETNSNDVAMSLVGDGNGLLISRNASGVPTNGQVLGDIGLNSYSSSQSMASSDAIIRATAEGDHSGSSAPSAMKFFTKPSTTGPGSAPTQRMVIDKDGNIGLGSSFSPAAVTGQVLQLDDAYFIGFGNGGS